MSLTKYTLRIENWKLKVENAFILTSRSCPEAKATPIDNNQFLSASWVAPPCCHPEAKVTSIFIHQSLSAWRVVPELIENWEWKLIVNGKLIMVNGVNKIYANINWKLKVENWECVYLDFAAFASSRCHPEAKVTSIFIHQSLSAWRVAPC